MWIYQRIFYEKLESTQLEHTLFDVRNIVMNYGNNIRNIVNKNVIIQKNSILRPDVPVHTPSNKN